MGKHVDIHERPYHIVGTLLTLLFLPALYVAWFSTKEAVQSS
jgi:hypothetical protein